MTGVQTCALPIYKDYILLDMTHIDAADIAPTVTWGTSPEHTAPITGVVPDPADAPSEQRAAAMRRSLAYMGLEPGTKLMDVPVDRVFIGSCTNGRIEDMRAVAAVAAGRSVAPNIIDAMVVPGSGLVKEQAEEEGLDKILVAAGFQWREPGCSMCLAMNPDKLQPEERCASTSNRNFEGRVHPLTRANYLASPPLVVAYALAGRVDIDFETEPIGVGAGGPVFLRDIWPTIDQIREVENEAVQPAMFRETYQKVAKGNKRWNELVAPKGNTFSWDDKSTYIHNPPFFADTTFTPAPIHDITEAFCLLNVGDSITTDHISPAGKISRNSPANSGYTGPYSFLGSASWQAFFMSRSST